MPFEVLAKILERALKRLGGSRSQRAERMAGSEELSLRSKLLEIAGPALSVFQGLQDALHPRQPAPARRAPAAGFLRKKVLQIPHHAHRTGLIIKHNHGACSQPAACFLN